MGYVRNIKSAIVTSGIGLKLSLIHFFQATRKRKQDVTDVDFFKSDTGIATLQFPHETIRVPDNGRYKLHNEIDDCIVCDKCAKICPVDCIDIISIKSPEVFGQTSDGTARRLYAEKFDIDMSKCMFCGLCTTVCPTECLTMTSDYDYSTFDIRDHLFPFGNMSDIEIKEKREAFEKYQEAKAPAVKPEVAETESVEGSLPKPAGAKPVFRPKMKPKVGGEESKIESSEATAPKKPVFRPKVKPKVAPDQGSSTNEASAEDKPTPAKPVFRPKIKPRPQPAVANESIPTQEETQKPVIKPVTRPKIQPKASDSNEPKDKGEAPKPKYRPRPIIKKPKSDE